MLIDHAPPVDHPLFRCYTPQVFIKDLFTPPRRGHLVTEATSAPSNRTQGSSYGSKGISAGLRPRFTPKPATFLSSVVGDALNLLISQEMFKSPENQTSYKKRSGAGPPQCHGTGGRGQQPAPPHGASDKTSGSNSTSLPSSASPGIPPEPPAAHGPAITPGLPQRHGTGGRGQQPAPPQGASDKTSGSISVKHLRAT